MDDITFPDCGQFPNVDALIPDDITDPTKTRCVTFNVKFLQNIAAALGAEDVTLTFLDAGWPSDTAERAEGDRTPTYMRPIFVEPARGKGRDSEVHDGRHALQMTILSTRR